MDRAQQLDEAVSGNNSSALLAGPASRNMGLDRSLRLIIEGSQRERSQLFGAGMGFSERHRVSPWQRPK
jgi:hypothetical protein